MTPGQKKKVGIFALVFIMGSTGISTVVIMRKSDVDYQLSQVINEMTDETDIRVLSLSKDSLVIMNKTHAFAEANIELDIQKIFNKEYRVSNKQFNSLVKDKQGNLILIKVNGAEFETKEITYLAEAKAVDIDENAIYILESNKVKKFNYDGVLVNEVTLNKSYQEIIGYKDNIYLFENKIAQQLGGIQIYLGGNLQQVHKNENEAYIINDFGKGKDNWMLVVLDLETFKVSNILAVERNTTIEAIVEDLLILEKDGNIFKINKFNLKAI